jgi:Neprosin
MSQYRKIFFSFAITAIGTATYAAPARTQDAAEVARRVEAARVQSFLDARYKASDVKHSFRTKLGDTIDCIDFFAQAGVKALAARGTPITKPPPSVTRPRNPDEPDENGYRRQCPDGTVPQVRITPDQIQRAGGLDAYLSRIKKFMGKLPSGSLPARSQRGSLTTSGPPAPGLPGYAHAYILGTGNNYTSGSARLSIWTPAIPSNNLTDHSLMQTWTTTGGNVATAATPTTPAVPCPANCDQTVEVGWIVDPGFFVDTNPHLFIYATPDGYWTGCYNDSIPINISGARTCPVWVGLPSSFPPGVTLPTSVQGFTGQGGWPTTLESRSSAAASIMGAPTGGRCSSMLMALAAPWQ